MRPSKRKSDEMRPISFERGVLQHAEGSCLIRLGNTHVLCTASVEERVPSWLRHSGRGWLSAEYGMLPRSTHQRMQRESSAVQKKSRSMEIQRLIGRSLRAVVDLCALGERQILIDCDVLQADGGTRTASITGAWMALYDCVRWMERNKRISRSNQVLRDMVAAVSCGVWQGNVLLDLDYQEDSDATIDANFVMTATGSIIEIQTTAEKEAFPKDQFMELMQSAEKGIAHIIACQKREIG